MAAGLHASLAASAALEHSHCVLVSESGVSGPLALLAAAAHDSCQKPPTRRVSVSDSLPHLNVIATGCPRAALAPCPLEVPDKPLFMAQ